MAPVQRHSRVGSPKNPQGHACMSQTRLESKAGVPGVNANHFSVDDWNKELIFRGVIMSGFSRNYHPAFAIFFSALLFALFHLNPWQFPAAFALGIILGWIRIRTGSVLACIAGHAIHNGLVFIGVIYFNNLNDLSFMQSGVTENYIIHFVVFAIGIASIWFITGEKAIKKATENRKKRTNWANYQNNFSFKPTMCWIKKN